MPCVSTQFNPQIGPVLTIGIALPGASARAVAAAAAAASGPTPPSAHAVPLLVDTGADITCISSSIAAQIGLRSIGLRPVNVPSGQAALHTYLADVIMFFGPIAQAGPVVNVPTLIVDNIYIMEFRGNNPHYQGLLGRDIISRGFFSMSSWQNSFTICM